MGRYRETEFRTTLVPSSSRSSRETCLLPTAGPFSTASYMTASVARKKTGLLWDLEAATILGATTTQASVSPLSQAASTSPYTCR